MSRLDGEDGFLGQAGDKAGAYVSGQSGATDVVLASTGF